MTTKTIPHPPRRVPILGDVLGMDRERPNQRTLWQFGQLGPIYRRSFVGGVDLTFVGSAELMREVVDETHWQRFAGRPIQRLRLVGGDGLFTAANDSTEWKHGHEVLLPGFTRDALASYHGAMIDVVETTTKYLADTAGTPLLATDVFGDIALEVIGRCGFGYSFDPFGEVRHPFSAALTRTLTYTQTSAIPVVGALKQRRSATQFEADRDMLRGTVEEVIAERRASDRRSADLLDLMLHPPVGAPQLPDDNIAEQVVTFLIAGHETTANLLSFAGYFVGRDPALAAAIRQEAISVAGDRALAYPEVAKLRYTRAVLSEVLRLWPTAPGFFREARHDTTLGDYRFAGGEWVFVSLLGVHRDQAAWGPDVDEFRPERFLSDAPVRPEMYKPFGTGPRACIGRAFALHEATLVLASLVRDFGIYVSSGELEVEETLTLRPSNVRLSFDVR